MTRKMLEGGEQNLIGGGLGRDIHKSNVVKIFSTVSRPNNSVWGATHKLIICQKYFYVEHYLMKVHE